MLEDNINLSSHNYHFGRKFQHFNSRKSRIQLYCIKHYKYDTNYWKRQINRHLLWKNINEWCKVDTAAFRIENFRKEKVDSFDRDIEDIFLKTLCHLTPCRRRKWNVLFKNILVELYKLLNIIELQWLIKFTLRSIIKQCMSLLTRIIALFLMRRMMQKAIKI